MTPSQPLPESSRLLLPLIDELRLACSLPALDADELAATVRIWAEVLFAEGVPPNQWRNCLIHCLRTRESSFAINVSELCKAWREIKSTPAPKYNCTKCKDLGIFTKDGKPSRCDCWQKHEEAA